MSTVTFKGTPVALSGNFPGTGKKAPDFVLTDNELKDKKLEDFKGKKKLILIVPSLETSVCSTCTKTFNAKAMNRKDLSVLVISADLPFTQKKYSVAEHVENVTILSMMRDKSFGESYGVLIKEGPLAGLCARAVLVLNENNEVVYSELVSEITSEPNYEKLFSYI